MGFTQHADSRTAQVLYVVAFKIWLAAVTNVFETGRAAMCHNYAALRSHQ